MEPSDDVDSMDDIVVLKLQIKWNNRCNKLDRETSFWIRCWLC